ncbi:MAG TPA: DMT family transporter [Candidatus Kapabacteria bacterium]|nr:DMT family transporter [Candidatus Kapabacteria bacterium]
MTDRTRGVLYLVAAAVLWSFGGLLIKKLGGLHFMATAGGRSAIAAVVLWFVARPISARITRGQLAGAICYAGTVICFVLATTTTTAANAILLQYTAPIYVALISNRLLGERITGVDWGSIAVVLAGMGLFFMDRLSGAGMLGNAFAVISGIFFAFNVVLLRRERHGSPMAIVLLGNIVTAIIGLPFLFVTPPTATDLLYLLPLGLFQLGLGYVLFVLGVRYVTAIEGTLIPVIEPLLNPLWVALFFGEQPGFHAIIGGAVVIAAVTGRGVVQALLSRRGAEPRSA